MPSSNPELDSPWRDGFLFLRNTLALDFVNTCPVQNGEAVELLPDFIALLRWFVAAEQITPTQAAAMEKKWEKTRRTQSFIREVRALRERLRSAVLKWLESGSLPAAMITELNQLLAEHPMRLRLRGSREAVSTQPYVKATTPEDLLAPLADSAAKLFATADRARLRQCENCVLLFLDTSKKGTRQWCSMQLCGNRSKVAAYAERQRARELDEKS
jgi:predicted RNA-binding Zn ribbon-like protein